MSLSPVVDPLTELALVARRLVDLLGKLDAARILQGERVILRTVHGERRSQVVVYVDGTDFQLSVVEGDGAGGLNMSAKVAE